MTKGSERAEKETITRQEQRMKAASAKLDKIIKRSKHVSTEEISSWIREDRER